MFSKKSSFRNKTLVMSAILFFCAACSIKVGEEAPPTTPYSYPETCLDQSLTNLLNFVEAKATDREVEFAFSCVGDILARMRDKVRGQDKDYFKASELSEFIEKNFFEEGSKRKITPELLHQAMLIKQLFVGGRSDILTRQEITRSIQFFNRLKKEAVAVNPFMSVYLQKWKPSFFEKDKKDPQYEKDLDFFEQANEALQEALDFLAGELEQNRQSYDFNNLPILIDEIDRFDGVRDGTADVIFKYLPVIKKLKKVLSGGSEDIVQNDEWRNFGTLGSRGYIQYLRYHYFIETAPNHLGLTVQLPYISRALEDIFDTLGYLVARKPEKRVNRAEILELFSTFSQIFPKVQLSDALLVEIMKIKRTLLGGNLEELTEKDFTAARSRVPYFRSFIETTSPYYRIYVGSWDLSSLNEDEAKIKFREAFNKLLVAIYGFSPALVYSYDLADIETLLKELDRLYPRVENRSSRSNETIDLVRKYLPLVISIKEVINDHAGSVIENKDWSQLLMTGSRGLEVYLYYTYFFDAQNLSKQKQWAELNQLFNDGSQVLAEVIRTKSKVAISSEEVLSLILSLKKLEILPKDVKEQTLVDIFYNVVHRLFLPPKERLQEVPQNGFGLTQLQLLKSDVQTFLYLLEFSDLITDNPLGKVSAVKYLTEVDRTLGSSGLSENQKAALTEMKALLTGPVLLNFDPFGRFYIGSDNRSFTNSSLVRLSLTRWVANLVVRGFAGNEGRTAPLTGAIDIEETTALFNFIKPLLLDLKLIDKIDLAFVKSRFLETNLFMPRSEYNEWASYTEISELVVHLLSGLQLNSDVQKYIRDEFTKPLAGACYQSKITSDTVIPLACFASAMRGMYSYEFSQLPKFAEFVASTNDVEWMAFIRAALLAAGYEGQLGSTIKLGDTALSHHFMQYLEMIYAKFDQNRDNVISTDEAARAFPTFKPVLKELAKNELDDGSIKESELYDLFAYILKNSKAPKTTLEKVKFKFSWIGKESTWNLAVDRKSIGRTLQYIADERAKKPSREE